MSVYPTWKNKNTGNVISIISDCSEAGGEQSLNSLHQMVEGSVDNLKIIKEEKIFFKNKPALLHYSQGELDSLPIEIESMSFKRKNCSYLTSLSGKKGNLELDRKAYRQFSESLTFE